MMKNELQIKLKYVEDILNYNKKLNFANRFYIGCFDKLGNISILKNFSNVSTPIIISNIEYLDSVPFYSFEECKKYLDSHNDCNEKIVSFFELKKLVLSHLNVLQNYYNTNIKENE